MFGRIKNPKIFFVDFNKPWWRLILKQKGIFFLILSMTTVMQVFTTVIPYLIALVFGSGRYTVCIGIFALWFMTDLLTAFVQRLNPRFQLQCIYSIYQNAHLYLLSVDPQYHMHYSRDTILGRIDRGARGYEELLDQITDYYTPLIVGLLTLTVVIINYSQIVAIALVAFIIAIIAGGYFFAKYASLRWENNFIKSDDVFTTTAAENLAQIQLIRSNFATDYRSLQLKNNIAASIKTEGALWLSYSSVSIGLTLLYLASLFILAMSLVGQVNHGLIPVASAVGLFLSYMQGTKSLVSSVKLFRRTMRCLAAIRELFAFIPTFGKQQIPIFGSSRSKRRRSEMIKIEALDICFDHGKETVFNHYSFTLHVSKKRSNKLYVVIGPQDNIKSTLLSILGGQLKPLSGTVFIDHVDIYEVNDAIHRQLIALQGQISTPLQGSVKSNLLLGLPDDNNYRDKDLSRVLEDVGLFSIFHEGLETKIGEGGLNLNGVEHQLLNFASLFLRASYYSPDVILIDEPTNETTEARISAMIYKLSRTATTLVIARTLKTVKRAAGIIDLSMLAQTQEIKPYSSQELLKRSEYYRLLMKEAVLC